MEMPEQINGWIEEIVAEFRPFLRGLSDQARNEFVVDKLATRAAAAFEQDPAFKKKYIRHRAEQDIDEFLESHRPQGEYDPGAVLPLDHNTYKLMSFASREDLVTWRALIAADPDKGSNLANMLYIDSRLKLWRDQPNLAELEKELSEASA